MNRSPEVALWYAAPSEVWSAEFLRRLASLASATRFGTAWLVARRTGLPGVVVVPEGTTAREVVVAAAAAVPGAVAPVGPGALGTPAPGDRFAVVCRSGARGGSPPRGEAPALAVPVPNLPVPGGAPAGGLQCHWFSTGTGRLAVRLRVWVRAANPAEPGALAAWTFPATQRLAADGLAVEAREFAATDRRRLAWSRGRIGGFAAGPFERLRAGVAAEVAAGPPPAVVLDDATLGRHVVVVGASGAGKSSFLAQVAAERIARGRSVLAVDVHGDLGPSIAARLGTNDRARLLAVDAGREPRSILGVRLLGDPEAPDDRAVPHLVAALKRLTSDSGDVYWGFRLERTLEAFVRLAHEEGGGLGDVHALLTDVRRRDAARATTRSPALAAFLDELPALVRRNPEYLVPAASRLAKVALEPRLLALLDAPGPRLSVLAAVAERRSIVWRVPFAELGPEASGFAATLLVTHAYLAMAAESPSDAPGPRAVFVVDEASALSARLLTELLTEARKFGIGVVLATQYPSRLAPEARAAAEGAAGTHLVFRVPAPVALETASWAGFDRSLAPMLAALPDGLGWVTRSGASGGWGVVQATATPADDGTAWSEAVGRTFDALSSGEGSLGGSGSDVDDAVAFALAAGDAGPAEISDRATGRTREPLDPVGVQRSLDRLVRRGWVTAAGARFGLTPGGARFLGVGAPSGAPSESAEHRALLDRALVVLARRGARLELVRQGRFDRRLPDAVVRQLPGPTTSARPTELARRLDAARATWTWRYFGGRDVDIEAEVSGALRPDRIRRNLGKARDRGTFVLFVVGDAARARRIRTVLAEERAGATEARVWTLRAPEGRAQPDARVEGNGGGALGR